MNLEPLKNTLKYFNVSMNYFNSFFIRYLSGLKAQPFLKKIALLIKPIYE